VWGGEWKQEGVVATAEWLLARGCDMHAKDHTGATALSLAEKKKKSPLAAFLAKALQRQPPLLGPDEVLSERAVATADARAAANRYGCNLCGPANNGLRSFAILRVGLSGVVAR
jgi:hypothetical protein